MTNSTQPRTFVRAINTLFAVALAAFVLASYWPIVKMFELARADLEVQGVWIGGHAKKITAVTPGGVADRAGLKPGDVLEFDPGRESDWVLASYRQMPEGFSATLPARHVDGSQTNVTLAPQRVAYLSSVNDRLALVARLCSLTLLMLVGVFMVWARPSLMTWALLFGLAASAPFLAAWVPFYLAFKAGTGFGPVAALVSSMWSWQIALVPFALCFPRDSLIGWTRGQRWLGLTLALALNAYVAAALYPEPFERDLGDSRSALVIVAVSTVSLLGGLAALARRCHRSNPADQARLKWGLLGIAASILAFFVGLMIAVARSVIPNVLGGSEFTPHNYVAAVGGVLFALSLGYAVLRERVVDVQFAVSRTLVYGAVSTLALVFLAAVHWLLGRLIEQSGLAIGLEGLAAIGLGLVLHRASHGITVLVDRVLFRKHHRAEERLRRVTAALPFASDERAIAEALVTDPARNLELASAALFYRDSPEGALNRVLAQGWGDEHAASLEADSLLVRYLQAEHAPLKLDDSQLLPAGTPEGAALPVLAIPIVNQHVLAAVVLYGAHVNHTLLDPDEIELLHALAKAAATSHSQVRIGALSRRNEQLEASVTELRALVRQRMASGS